MVSLDGKASVSPTGGWYDLDFRWELAEAPARVMAAYRSQGDEWLRPSTTCDCRSWFYMPQLHVGESLVFKLTTTIWGQTDTDTVRVTSLDPLPGPAPGDGTDSHPVAGRRRTGPGRGAERAGGPGRDRE